MLVLESDIVAVPLFLGRRGALDAGAFLSQRPVQPLHSALL